MKISELKKLYGLQFKKVEDGYKEYHYEATLSGYTFIISKDDVYGIKLWSAEYKDNALVNPFGKTLYWNNKEDLLNDLIKIVSGRTYTKAHTYC